MRQSDNDNSNNNNGDNEIKSDSMRIIVVDSNIVSSTNLMMMILVKSMINDCDIDVDVVGGAVLCIRKSNGGCCAWWGYQDADFFSEQSFSFVVSGRLVPFA